MEMILRDFSLLVRYVIMFANEREKFFFIRRVDLKSELVYQRF